MDGQLDMASWEQEWDDHLGMADERHWGTTTHVERKLVENKMEESANANAAVAKKMLAIVDEEQRLADIEKKEWLREKRKRYRQRKRERDEAIQGLPKF
jgi:hypothetical protein